MPPSDATAAPRLHRDGEVLRFEGPLTRAFVAPAWREARGLLDGLRTLDVGAVTRVDSAGVALLAELAARAGGAALRGEPPGLADLRAAYRLSPSLDFA